MERPFRTGCLLTLGVGVGLLLLVVGLPALIAFLSGLAGVR